MSLTKRLYLVTGLVAILAIAFGAITLTSHLTSAQSASPTPTAKNCDQQDEADDAAEAATEEADTDDLEDECGSENEGSDAGEADTDADGVQEPQLNGSISVDESQYKGLSETDEATALASLATITPEQASAAAQAEVPGDVQQVELESENGSLVYSVEIGGKDVKVDAGTGAVLHIETGGAED